MSDINSSPVSPEAVGALLYAPGNHPTIADSVIGGTLPTPYSLALCLEDAISDRAVETAEQQAVQTVRRIAAAPGSFYRPLLFIRVRAPEQMARLLDALARVGAGLTGFIAPKFSCDNAPAYLRILADYNAQAAQPRYFMPILESGDLVDLRTRAARLYAVRDLLAPVRRWVLNIRVGGNDFCKRFGVRRRCDQTIHEIGCVRSLLDDIVTCFSQDYIVSGPVWEYFDDPAGDWRTGMERELARDRLSGFLGKTVIHPNQIPVVNAALQPTAEDAADAHSLLALRGDDDRFVAKSAAGSRMNELKTHEQWAWRTLALAERYGVRDGAVPSLPQTDGMARAAMRENNTKRPYLIVNPLQGKHVPAVPGDALAVFDRLAAQVRAAIAPQDRTLVIGFAETATAIGAALAASLPGETWYVQTTREAAAAGESLYFSETHSHATEQRLSAHGLAARLAQVQHVVFAEDEVTTGNTIRHLIAVLRGAGLPDGVQLHIASLLNGMSGAHGAACLRDGIALYYLQRTDNAAIARAITRFAYDGETLPPDRSPALAPQRIALPELTMARSPRTLLPVQDYVRACQAVAQAALHALPADADRVLVVGAEECMYPGLVAGQAIAQAGRQVRFHATTRSPIRVSRETGYPLTRRAELRSLYDGARVTYLYNLTAYDWVLIVADGTPDETGLATLLHALHAAGSGCITLLEGAPT